jgi:hypothetical protein
LLIGHLALPSIALNTLKRYFFAFEGTARIFREAPFFIAALLLLQ